MHKASTQSNEALLPVRVGLPVVREAARMRLFGQSTGLLPCVIVGRQGHLLQVRGSIAMLAGAIAQVFMEPFIVMAEVTRCEAAGDEFLVMLKIDNAVEIPKATIRSLQHAEAGCV